MKPKTIRAGDFLLAFWGLRFALWALVSQAFLPDIFQKVHWITPHHDEHFYYLHEEVARKTIVDFHQLPTWNPYYCGGVPGIANPQDISLAPDFLLRLIWGVGPGRKLAMLLFLILGMEGLYRLARRHNASSLGAAVGAIAFAVSGTFPNLLSLGWIHMFAYLLLPWVALCFEEGITKRSWAILGGIFIAWLVLCGGTYSVPFAGLILGVLLVVETVRILLSPSQKERWYQPSLCLLIIGITALGLTAIRTFPMIPVVFGTPRIFFAKESIEPMAMLTSIAFPKELGGDGLQYMGQYAFLLAVFGVLIADKSAARCFIVGLCFAALAIGEWREYAPYVFLHKLPIYSQLRNPGRMAVLAVLFFSVATARGLTRIEDSFAWLAHRIWDRYTQLRSNMIPLNLYVFLSILGGLLALKIGSLAVEQVVNTNAVVPNSQFVMEPPLRHPDDFRQSRGNRWEAQIWPFIDRGSLACFEETPFFQSPSLRGDLAQEEYPSPDSNATVTRVKWTPSEITLKVEASSPSRILINQNYNPYWKSTIGNVVSDEGRLAIQVPQGVHHLVVSYRDPFLLFGSLISIGTLLFLSVLALRASMAWWQKTKQKIRIALIQ